MKDPSFLIIPSVVADDERLTPFDQILFSRIYSLSRQYGYCFATNEYLSNKMNVSPSYITKTIRKLRDLNYIDVQIDRLKINSQRRKIYVNRLYLDQLMFEEKEIDSLVL